jgi:hypothetical protein
METGDTSVDGGARPDPDRQDWPEPLRSIHLGDLTVDALIDWIAYCAAKNLFWGSLREELKLRLAMERRAGR